ncbi:hypothetical protein OH492_26490 [Vibrio chagasii]|nr:hypothetical protein [Vibrio chagasii]
MIIKASSLYSVSFLLLFSTSHVNAFEQTQEETAVTFGLSAERGWRRLVCFLSVKYRGPGTVGYGVEFTRSAYNEDDGAYEYKQRDNEYQFHAPIGITDNLYITPGYGIKRTHTDTH